MNGTDIEFMEDAQSAGKIGAAKLWQTDGWDGGGAYSLSLVPSKSAVMRDGLCVLTGFH